jgi:predicted nucleic acid-binding protein
MYCDSAIFVKLLTVEADSAYFERGLRGNPLRSSELARAEVFAALAGKERAGQLQPADRQRAWRQFQSWLEDSSVVLEPLDSRVMDRTIHTIDRCHPQIPLRTLDAIHVATCDQAHEFPLAATDRRLRAGAHQLGIPLFPARLPSDLF